MNHIFPYRYTQLNIVRTPHLNYYDSVDYIWLVYLSNDIIDPVYGWHLDTREFEKYIIKKYGSIGAAKANLEGYKDNDGTGRKYSVDTFTLSSDPNKSNWIPIYSYDREDEENEAKLTIKLLDKRFANQAQKNLVALLNE